MLQNIGDKLKSQRWLATLILGLLALIFAAWGAYGIVNVSFAPQDYGLKINGVDIISFDAEHRITHFKVMVRPLKAINLLHRLMGEQLVVRF